MDALQMLREDHRRVRELFRQFEEATDKATKRAAAETALVELNVHSLLEEEIFYPAVRRQGNGSGEMVERAEQGHHTANQLMNELMKMEPGNQDFDAKFHVLIENVKSHIDEEEAEMLPQAAEAGLSRMEQLGERMAERRAQLLSENGNGRQGTRSTAGTRARSTSPTRARSTGTRTPSTTGTRSRSTVTRAKAASGKGKRAGTSTRSKSPTARGSRSGAATRSRPAGTRSRAISGTSRARAVSSGAKKSPVRTAAKRSATRATGSNGLRSGAGSRTVKQAGGTRTTRTRSSTGARRSGSQSGR